MKWILKIILLWFIFMMGVSIVSVLLNFYGMGAIFWGAFDSSSGLMQSKCINALISNSLSFLIGGCAILAWRGSRKYLHLISLAIIPQIFAINYRWNVPDGFSPGEIHFDLYQWDFSSWPKFFMGPMFDRFGGIQFKVGSFVESFGPGIYLNIFSLCYFLFIAYYSDFANLQPKINMIFQKIWLAIRKTKKRTPVG